jgi:hypothetical protein
MAGAVENNSAGGVKAPPESALDYAPRRNAKRLRRVVLRRIVPLALLVALAWPVLSYRSQLSLRAQRVYWGWRCARHVTPADTVLFERDPEKMAQLLAHNPDYLRAGQEWGPGNRSGVFPAHAIYWPESFRRYFPLSYDLPYLAPPGMMHLGVGGISFMGERRSPAGHKRLVVVPMAELNAFSARAELGYSLVLPLPDALGGIESLAKSPKAFQWSGRFVPLRLKPGVADAADPSHVSLEYVIDNDKRERRGFIDLYLRDDETVDARFRDPGAVDGL